jgi:hypothetical protein
MDPVTPKRQDHDHEIPIRCTAPLNLFQLKTELCFSLPEIHPVDLLLQHQLSRAFKDQGGTKPEKAENYLEFV